MRWWLAVMATSQKGKDKLFLSEIMIYYIYFYKGGRGQDISFCTAEGLCKIFAYKSEFLAYIFVHFSSINALIKFWTEKSNVRIDIVSKRKIFINVFGKLVVLAMKFFRKNWKTKRSCDQISWRDYTKDKIALSVTNENLYELRCFKFYLCKNAVQCLMIFYCLYYFVL